MNISSILQFLLPLLSSSLTAEGLIPANLQGLVGASAAAIATLVSQLIGGNKTPSAIALAALQAVKTEIDALKASGTLFTLNQANEINAVDLGMSDAITAYENSLKVTDPSNLTPLPTEL